MSTITPGASEQPLTRLGMPLDAQLRILAIGQFANRFGTER